MIEFVNIDLNENIRYHLTQQPNIHLDFPNLKVQKINKFTQSLSLEP